MSLSYIQASFHHSCAVAAVCQARRSHTSLHFSHIPDSNTRQMAQEETRPRGTIILPSHNFNFQGLGGEVAHCSGFWSVGFLNSDIHPGANPGKGSVSNYSSHPRTQCSASHILTISKTRETTPTSTEYFYTHGKTTHKMKGYKTVWS